VQKFAKNRVAMRSVVHAAASVDYNVCSLLQAFCCCESVNFGRNVIDIWLEKLVLPSSSSMATAYTM